MLIDICLSPILFPTYNLQKDACVVVTDIFRATTSMCTAFSAGVKSILPIADIEGAKALKTQGYLVGAERNVSRCDFADFGNSPFDYMTETIRDKEIVMTTTNGTQAIEAAKENPMLLIGSFSNFSTVADYCSKQQKHIIILCSGWSNHVNMEDTLFAAALAESLIANGYQAKSDAVHIALTMWKETKNDIRSFIQCSEHIERLLNHELEKDIDYCLTFNTTSVLPYYDKSKGKIFDMNK